MSLWYASTDALWSDMWSSGVLGGSGRNYQLLRQESREGLKENNLAMCRKTCSYRKLRGYVRVHREIVRCNVVDRDDALKISLAMMEIL
mmetsp:Transcript_2972/g.3279  ORF Transcript_2972/g.3279 Transcript_2972/m.3279 type:complete len:89 (+) Transcript_2972:15-281(+)